VNDNPTIEFKPHKEIRQRDSLTPFLFFIAGLLGAVKEGERKWLFEGVKVGRNEVVISML